MKPTGPYQPAITLRTSWTFRQHQVIKFIITYQGSELHHSGKMINTLIYLCKIQGLQIYSICLWLSGSSFGEDLSLKQETNVGGASELPMTEYISKMLSNYQSQDIDGGVDNFNFEDDDESFAHKNLRVEWCRKISESPSSKEEPGSWMTVVQKDLGSGFTFVAPQDGSEPIFLPTNQLRFYQAGS